MKRTQINYTISSSSAWFCSLKDSSFTGCRANSHVWAWRRNCFITGGEKKVQDQLFFSLHSKLYCWYILSFGVDFLSHDIFLTRLLYLISVVYKKKSCVFPRTSPHNEELLTAHILQFCKVLWSLFCQKRTWPQAYQWSARTSVSCAFWYPPFRSYMYVHQVCLDCRACMHFSWLQFTVPRLSDVCLSFSGAEKPQQHLWSNHSQHSLSFSGLFVSCAAYGAGQLVSWII